MYQAQILLEFIVKLLCMSSMQKLKFPESLRIFQRKCTLNRFLSKIFETSVVDLDPYGIRIHNSGALWIWIRIRIPKVYFFQENSFPLTLCILNFVFQNCKHSSGSGSNLGQNPGSGSKFNVFLSPTLLGIGKEIQKNSE